MLVLAALLSAVLVVDDTPGPGVDFATIQAAIDAAADGDIVLVRSGSYAGFTIRGKSVVVQAEAGAAITFIVGLNEIAVAETAAHQPVVLRGLRPPAGNVQVVLRGCEGPVLLEDCRFECLSALAPAGPNGLRADRCASLALQRCDLRGAPGFSIVTFEAGRGLEETESRVAAYGSTFAGGRGPDGQGIEFTIPAGPGADGARIVGGAFFASDCVFTGGAGGNKNLSAPPWAAVGGAGGDGLAGRSAAITTYNAAAAGGAGGAGSPNGSNGNPFSILGGWESLSGPRWTFAAASPVHPGSPLHLAFDCSQPALVTLVASSELVPAGDAHFTLGPVWIDLGSAAVTALPACGGASALDLPAPALPPSVQGLRLALQAIFADPIRMILHASGPSHAVILSGVKIATWNVNSIRVRLPRVLAWLERTKPDVACLQETKVEDAIFPRAAIEAAGYRVTTFGQKTYNGVAILSRPEPEDVVRGLPEEGADAQKRVLAATIGGVRVVNVYVPNGESVESEKFPFKLEWLRRLRDSLAARRDPARPLLLCGDFNVAPEDRDVHDPERWRGKVLFHPDERARLAEIMALGLADAFRIHTQEAGHHTWWDYRAGAFHRGWGLRIDLMLASEPLARACRAVTIDRDERKGTQPSDHAPVIAEFE